MSWRMAGNVTVTSILMLLAGVLGKDCWSVTYTPQRVCHLKGSSADLSCSYKYPGRHTVIKSFWYIKEKQVGVEPVDVREEAEYRGRVQYNQSSQNYCRMTLTHLRESDAHEFNFRFHTDEPGGKYTGKPGVYLSVTDLKVTVSNTSTQQTTLTCRTTCTLSNNPTYIWYRNGQPVSNQNSKDLYVYHSSEDAVSYSCAIRGYEELLSPAVYPPRDTRAVMVPSGQRVEGDSVTLTCNSDANPPVLRYSWFKQREAADTQLGTDQNYSITNVGSQHSGLYYCTAHNQLGQENSSTTHLDVFCIPAGTYAASGLTVGVFLTLTAVCLWMRRRAEAVRNKSEETSAKVCLNEGIYRGHDNTPMYDNVSALDMTSDPTASSVNQDDIQYSSVHFTRSHTQEVPLYSTVQLPKALNLEEEVEYTTVNFTKTNVTARKDETPVYSKVQRI